MCGQRLHIESFKVMVQNVVRFFTKIDYLLRETFLGLRRGGWMNWAAISTVAVLLFLFGASFIGKHFYVSHYHQYQTL